MHWNILNSISVQGLSLLNIGFYKFIYTESGYCLHRRYHLTCGHDWSCERMFSAWMITLNKTYCFNKANMKLQDSTAWDRNTWLHKQQLHPITKLNTLRPWQNGWHFADNTYKCIFLNENYFVSIQLSSFPRVGLTKNYHWSCHPGNDLAPKRNLVSKIWLPTLVNICNGLPNLVVNISSQIHQLVNTGLAVGTCRMATNKSSRTCKLHTIWVVYYSPIGNGSIRL